MTNCDDSLSCRRGGGRAACAAAALVLLLWCAGCQRSEPVANIPSEETWELIQVQGDKIGYQHTTTVPDVDSGRSLRRIESDAQFTMNRDSSPVSIRVLHASWETPSGELVRYHTETFIGPTPMVVNGSVSGGRLVIETETAGKASRDSVDWPAEAHGFMAVEQSLAQQPMQPGEHRTLQALVYDFNRAGTIELTAEKYESTPLLDGPQELLRIDQRATVNGQRLPGGVLWMDRQGIVLKSRSEVLQMETYRTTKEVALAKGSPSAKFDLSLATFVQPDQSLRHPHDTRRVRYEVHLDGENPAEVFPSGSSQQVKSLDAHTARELTVHAVRPGDSGGMPEPPPTDADRLPNNMIQSDNPKVIALARQVAVDETDPWRIAVALEELVHRKMRQQDLSQGFATAADVAESLSGDCTEYGVLLAGLARARGIPARVAVGLVYTPQGFGFHLWTEMWISDRWIPLDATLGRGGIGAAHLKIAHTNLPSSSAFTGFLPVAKVIGRLKIKILEVDSGQ